MSIVEVVIIHSLKANAEQVLAVARDHRNTRARKL